MRWNLLLRDLGIFLQIPALLIVPTVLVCLAFREWSLLPGLGIVVAISVGLSQLLLRRRVDPEAPTSLASSMMTVGATWLGIGLITSIPFLYWGRFGDAAGVSRMPFADFWTSWFESMSGITSTGLTMAKDPSLLPHTIQWWRSLLEWVGGIGVVVLALAVIRPAEAGKALMNAEAREDRIGTTFRATAGRIWLLFTAFTAFSILLFLATGMPWWEAINHGMTGIATGGFTVTARSFTPYTTTVQLAAILVMLLGAVSFRTYAALLTERDWRSLARDVPTLTLLALLVAGAAALVLVDRQTDVHRGAVAVAFHWASALGTCGFQAGELSSWSPALLLLLIVAMFIGGCSGSTTGGIKIDRAILVVLGPFWQMRRRLSTRRGVQYYTIDGKKVDERDALKRYGNAVALASLFFGCILLGTLVLLLCLGPHHSAQEIAFEVTSALSNVGLSTGITTASLPWSAKLTLILTMWMGRLEITAVLVLLGMPIAYARNGFRKA